MTDAGEVIVAAGQIIVELGNIMKGGDLQAITDNILASGLQQMQQQLEGINNNVSEMVWVQRNESIRRHNVSYEDIRPVHK